MAGPASIRSRGHTITKRAECSTPPSAIASTCGPRCGFSNIWPARSRGDSAAICSPAAGPPAIPASGRGLRQLARRDLHDHKQRDDRSDRDREPGKSLEEKRVREENKVDKL